jgi:hypothetical protein
MRKLVILAILSLVTASSAGCFHRQCCGTGGGLFGWRAAQQQTAAYPCCDPCATPAPVMSSPCCCP